MLWSSTNAILFCRSMQISWISIIPAMQPRSFGRAESQEWRKNVKIKGVKKHEHLNPISSPGLISCKEREAPSGDGRRSSALSPPIWVERIRLNGAQTREMRSLRAGIRGSIRGSILEDRASVYLQFSIINTVSLSDLIISFAWRVFSPGSACGLAEYLSINEVWMSERRFQ